LIVGREAIEKDLAGQFAAGMQEIRKVTAAAFNEEMTGEKA
jgi:hypothetical protein